MNATGELLKGACHCGAVQFTAKLTERDSDPRDL